MQIADDPMTLDQLIAENLDRLTTVAESLGGRYLILANYVIHDELFQKAPGSSSHHHAYRGGLLQHTREVVDNVYLLCGEKPRLQHFDELVLAAIWHDYCKIYEYAIEMDYGPTRPEGAEVIRKLDYRVRIGHVAGSFAEFLHQARVLGASDHLVNTVGHIMLAHHGRLEWRSPVEPQTAEAFILHSADMLSARPS